MSKKLTAKKIKKLRSAIIHYREWIPSINNCFNVNVTVREVMNNHKYMTFIDDQRRKEIIYSCYRASGL